MKHDGQSAHERAKGHIAHVISLFDHIHFQAGSVEGGGGGGRGVNLRPRLVMMVVIGMGMMMMVMRIVDDGGGEGKVLQVDDGGDLTRPSERSNLAIGRRDEDLLSDGEESREGWRRGGGGGGRVFFDDAIYDGFVEADAKAN